MASIKQRGGRGGPWRARYVDGQGKQHERLFQRRADAQAWIDQVTTSIVSGTYVAPRTARTTVAEWADEWLVGYAANRGSTVRQAKVHLARIKDQFGDQRLADVRPSHVRAWVAALQREGLEPSYVFALHARLAQLYNDAIHDGIVSRSPCSRKTSPGMGKQRPYVATTEQVWALQDAMPDHLRIAVLLGALAGLRSSEACGLRVSDVDFMRGIVNPVVQYPEEPLKTAVSMTPVPVGNLMALQMSAHVKAWPSPWVLSNRWGKQLGPWTLELAIRDARAQVAGLPGNFRFHDLRHYFASLLIADGHDVKLVQTRLRHASARTTLDTYSHLWPDKDEAARATVDGVLAARAASAKGGSRANPNLQA